MTYKIKDVNYIGTEDNIGYSPEINIDIFIKGILVSTIRININIHHGININIDTNANMERQLLNICFHSSVSISTAIPAARKGG